MFAILVHEVAHQLGKRLSYLEGPSFLDLPNLARRVLLHLLEGESEKQVAKAMDISRHTVHEHVKKTHQRYGVKSRGELLSKFMARSALEMLRNTLDEDA
ncbi:MAG: helix-turn-helix domain-containing protein [Planctomycetales bacterium]|nr:helix-turn-helix domain-containing protein [Planctomycetales bacterium]